MAIQFPISVYMAPGARHSFSAAAVPIPHRAGKAYATYAPPVALPRGALPPVA